MEASVALKPDVVILDYSMPMQNGVEATRGIRAKCPRTEVLIFTMHDSEDVVHDILVAGARGYLLKADANNHLIAAVQALGRHEAYISGKLSANLLDTLVTRRVSRQRELLTRRERAVVQLIAEGNTNKTVCTMLGVSLKTVESHRASAMRKLGCHTTADLVRYAVRNRMVGISDKRHWPSQGFPKAEFRVSYVSSQRRVKIAGVEQEGDDTRSSRSVSVGSFGLPSPLARATEGGVGLTLGLRGPMAASSPPGFISTTTLIIIRGARGGRRTQIGGAVLGNKSASLYRLCHSIWSRPSRSSAAISLSRSRSRSGAFVTAGALIEAAASGEPQVHSSAIRT